MVTCAKPTLPADGYVTAYSFDVRADVIYHCNEGYRLETGGGEMLSVFPSYLPSYLSCTLLLPLGFLGLVLLFSLQVRLSYYSCFIVKIVLLLYILTSQLVSFPFTFVYVFLHISLPNLPPYFSSPKNFHQYFLHLSSYFGCSALFGSLLK